jgi:cytochrome c-type biogenesis protein CcmH/NrfG
MAMTIFIPPQLPAVFARPCRPLVLLLVLLLVLGGCVSTSKKVDQAPPKAEPPPQEVPKDQEKKVQPGPAAGLYNEAEKALTAGRAGDAEMFLERALRIEPRNPLYWYTLARAKFNQRLYAETIQLCRKVETLLGKGAGSLASRNKALQAQAKIAAKSP